MSAKRGNWNEQGLANDYMETIHLLRILIAVAIFEISQEVYQYSLKWKENHDEEENRIKRSDIKQAF